MGDAGGPEKGIRIAIDVRPPRLYEARANI